MQVYMLIASPAEKKHRKEANMAEKSSPSVKTLSSQDRNDQNTNDADNIPEIEELLTFFVNDTKRKAHDKNTTLLCNLKNQSLPY